MRQFAAEDSLCAFRESSFIPWDPASKKKVRLVESAEDTDDDENDKTLASGESYPKASDATGAIGRSRRDERPNGVRDAHGPALPYAMY
jgi:hypothetical protein